MKNNIIERWKPIKGYKGLYEVSDFGNVRSLNYRKTGKTRVLSPSPNSGGYLLINLSKDGKMKPFYVHTLVFSTFNGPIPSGMTIDHVNGIKTDNKPENLQLLTREENTRKGNLGKTPWNLGKPAWNRGKKFSEEARTKMSLAAKARFARKPCSEETRTKMSLAAKARHQREKEGITGH